MLVFLYLIITNVLVPKLGAYANALLGPVMTIVIILFGMIMLCGSIGIKISENLGATIFSGIGRAISFLIRTLIHAVAWIVRSTFRLLPRVFTASRDAYATMGAGPFLRNLLAVLTAIVVLVAII